MKTFTKNNQTNNSRVGCSSCVLLKIFLVLRGLFLRIVWPPIRMLIGGCLSSCDPPPIRFRVSYGWDWAQLLGSQSSTYICLSVCWLSQISTSRWNGNTTQLVCVKNIMHGIQYLLSAFVVLHFVFIVSHSWSNEYHNIFIVVIVVLSSIKKRFFVMLCSPMYKCMYLIRRRMCPVFPIQISDPTSNSLRMATSSLLPNNSNATTTKPVVREWADEDDSSNNNKLPPREEWYDEEGLKHVVEYHFNDDNKLVKTTKVFRVKKQTRQVSKTVAERRHWKKFGDCQKAPPGPEPGVTAVSLDDISIEYKHGEGSEGEEDLKAKEQKDIQKMLAMQRFKRRLEERRAGVANWAQLMALKAGAQRDELEAPATNTNAANTGKYVPPHLRAGAKTSSDSSYTRDDSATVRVSNLSPNTTESDLQELFRPFGNIRRIFISKDRHTGEGKGFAFVAFSNKEDARKCIEKLDGYGYDHLILRCEWAKPSENKRGQK